MQELIFYVNAASTLGVCRDSFDAKTVALPTIIRGGEVLFRMRLFSGNSPREQYPLEALQNVVSWEWNMDADYDEDTPCKLVADNSAITVGEVEEERDGTTTVYTEIQIPVSQTNTVELRDWLSSAESKSDLSAELAGYDVDGKLAFILQLKGFTVRNRIVSAGTPTEIPDSYLDEAGVRALLAAGFEVQCAESADAEDSAWISATDAPDTYLWTRSRLRGNSAAAWSTPCKRIVGPPNTLTIGTVTTGEPGTNASVEITGEAPNQTVNFAIPRGDTGESGTAVGSISLFAGAALPEGYLLCDGAELSREVYAELFSAIGTTWGEGDGENTFNIPDLRGKFIRGCGGNAAPLGTEQSEGLPDATGWFKVRYGTVSEVDGAAFSLMQAETATSTTYPGQQPSAKMSFSLSGANPIFGASSHVTPENCALNVIIKYQGVKNERVQIQSDR